MRYFMLLLVIHLLAVAAGAQTSPPHMYTGHPYFDSGRTRCNYDTLTFKNCWLDLIDSAHPFSFESGNEYDLPITDPRSMWQFAWGEHGRDTIGVWRLVSNTVRGEYNIVGAMYLYEVVAYHSYSITPPFRIPVHLAWLDSKKHRTSICVWDCNTYPGIDMFKTNNTYEHRSIKHHRNRANKRKDSTGRATR